MSGIPRTSIVVPTRGGRHRLPRLLASLTRQDDPDFEVIVVVDGDIDDSAGFLASLPDEFAGLEVTPIVFDENQGRSRALNAGFAAARGEILVRCDDDLEPEPNYVSRRVELHSRGQVGVVGLYRNATEDTAYSRAYGLAAEQRLKTAGYAAAPDRRWQFWQGNVSVDRATWEQVGPYDDVHFRAYGWEDVDWGYRLTRAGVEILIDPELETVHRAAADTTARRIQRALYSGAAGRRFATKHGVTEEVVSGGATAKAGVWNLAVAGTAKMLDEKRVGQVGRVVDKALPRLPEKVGGKVIALLVESAFVSGKQNPDSVGRAI